ncbi:aldolase [Priestia megaterium]|uniref:aldolase n=1 Tax=Priestia megaterium TaxID=1404 RepID=UPI002E1DFA32|nr:aldolase [Priestia megaterium]
MITKRKNYNAFGLSISSEIELPELQVSTEPVNKNETLEIKIENLAEKWNEVSTNQKHIVVTEQFVMMKIPNSAIFYIEEGRNIIVSPLEKSDESAIRLYLLGSCMGIVLMQRKILPLHGSSVVINGKAYAFIGDSGAGKSTLASAFLQRGHQLLTDDVIAVSLSQKGQPFVTPAYPQQKLWQESLDAFGLENTNYRPIYDRETKYSVPVVSKFYEKPLPLAGLFELVKTEEGIVQINRIEKLERFRTLFHHTYRNFLIPQLDLMEWHFSTSVQLLNYMSMFQIKRTTAGFTANDLVSAIIDVINEEERINEKHSNDFTKLHGYAK